MNNQLYTKYKNGFIDKKQVFMSANDFDKYINNEIKVLDEYSWINNCGSKARKKLYKMPKPLIKVFLKVKLSFLSLKRKINVMLNYTFLRIIKAIGRWIDIE